MKPSLHPCVPGIARRAMAFTLIELLAVISIIAVLAGLLVGLAPQAAARMKESRTRAELENLVTAIEAYKAKYGVYPPDNVTGRDSFGSPIVNPVVNPLYYELTGLVVHREGTGGYFLPIGYEDNAKNTDGISLRLDADTIVLPTFNRDGFVNAALTNNLRRLFHHDFKPSQRAFIPPKSLPIEVLVAPVPWPPKDAKFPSPFPVAGYETLNPWRYVSSNPTNNPTSYDLWAEIIVRGQKRIIGNWKN
jgi:prepilin-type N-terminal cleavage/methylation domain-containing protein